MKLIPAIDLKDNKCIRLTIGKEQSAIIYNDNPIEQAKFFEKEGCERILIIDLDSTLNRSAVYNDTIINILDVVLMVNIILGENSPSSTSDMNMDGITNVLDIILLINIILEN